MEGRVGALRSRRRRPPRAAPHVGEDVLQLGLGLLARPAVRARAQRHVLALAVRGEAQGVHDAGTGLALDDLALEGAAHQSLLGCARGTLGRYPGDRQELHVARGRRATEALRAALTRLRRESVLEHLADAERIKPEARPGAAAQADGTELGRVLVRGTTILLATHDPVVAAKCDRLIRLQDGQVTDDVDLRAGSIDVAALLAGSR